MATSNDLISIEASHNLYVQRLAAQYGNDALPYIESMQEQITARVNREVGKNLTANRRDKLLKDIDTIVNTELRSYTRDLSKNDADFGKYEADWQGKTLGSMHSIEPVVIGKQVINQTAKNTLIKLGDGSYTSYNQMLSNYTATNAQQITNIVAQGFSTGMTTREIANQVLDDVDNRVVKTKRDAKFIARTGTNHYANQARRTYFSEEPVVIGTRRIATLDSATSGYCRGIDNTVVLKDDPDYATAFAPFHPNCRTANAPEIDDVIAGPIEGDRPENFRDAESGLLDPGTTSSKKIYYESFKSLDAASQDAILGPSLGRAFRKGIKDGTLTPQSFAKLTIDEKNLIPLTLTEMKSKDTALAKILKEQDNG